MMGVYGGGTHSSVHYDGRGRPGIRPVPEAIDDAPGPIKILVRDGVPLATPEVLQPTGFGFGTEVSCYFGVPILVLQDGRYFADAGGMRVTSVDLNEVMEGVENWVGGGGDDLGMEG